MITKTIDGVKCTQRDVVYTDFGAATQTEKAIAKSKSVGQFKTESGRSEFLEDVQYSWDKDTFDYEFESDRNFSYDEENEGVDYEDEELDRAYSVQKDTVYSTGQLPTRLITLRRPLNIQLKDLYREHARVYKSKGKNMKRSDIDLIMEDFRYELLRIVAKAKDRLNESGGNMDTILKVSTVGGGQEVKRALMQMTILFKRIEKAYETYGFIPRNFQVKLNDSLSLLVNHFVIDVYGPELEKRKMESEEEREESYKRND